MKADNLSLVARKSEDLLASLHVPQLGRVVHRPSGYQHTMRVEGETDDLHFVSF